MKNKITLLFGLLIALVVSNQKSVSSENRQIWAFLVAGSSGYYNYRHQADLCHAYQILHENGIPDENIIVMMADDIAFNQENPTPGVIINSPGGPNVYEGVPKDYTGKDVNPLNFINILSGNKTAMKNIGSGRVIESGPNDHVFVNFVDHGGAGVFCFDEEVLTADVLIDTLKSMASRSQFSKMILYIEACFSGSMFDDLLDDDLNIFALTAADPHESSYACYYDAKRQTYLGDVFSVNWLNDSEHESLPQESIHHQFEKVRTRTNASHVEEYGDLDIGETKLSEIIGFRMRGQNSPPAPPINDDEIVSNIDVPLELLSRKIIATRDTTERNSLQIKKQRLLKARSMVDTMFKRIVAIASNGDDNRKQEINTSQMKLGKGNFKCYKTLLKVFSNNCLSVAKNPYVRSHLPKLVNMCAVSWLDTTMAVRALVASCGHKKKAYISYTVY